MPVNKPRREDGDVRPQGRATLTLREKELLVRSALRCPDLYPSVVKELKPAEHFEAQDEKWLGDVVAAMQRYHKAMAKTVDEADIKPPTGEQLRTFYEKLIRDTSEDDFIQEDADMADHFIRLAFKCAERDIEQERRHAGKVFEYLLQEGLHLRIKEVADMDGEVPENIPELLQDWYEQAQSSRVAGLVEVDLPFPEEEDDTPLIKETTGLDVLDNFMGGGQAAGEVNGVCAPFGTCKTTLTVQLGVLRAEWEQTRFRKKLIPTLPWVYLAFYEETMAQVRVRVQSCASKIERKIIEDRDYARFSTNKKSKDFKKYENKALNYKHLMEVYKSELKTYLTDLAAWEEEWKIELAEWSTLSRSEQAEIAKPPQHPKKPNGERERFALAKLRMNMNLCCLDFAGDKYGDAASDGALGLRRIIDEHQRRHDNPGVSLVVMDYAGAAADRMMEKYDYDENKRRQLIGKMPMRLKTNIANPYKCPVWVTHQLNADANAKAAGIAPKGTDSAEAKNFFEHVDFGFMVGTKSDAGYAVISNTKQRREARKKNAIIYINGLMCKVEDAKNHVVEGNQIVLRSDAERTGGVPEPEEFARRERQRKAKAKKEAEEAVPTYRPHNDFHDK